MIYYYQGKNERKTTAMTVSADGVEICFCSSSRSVPGQDELQFIVTISREKWSNIDVTFFSLRTVRNTFTHNRSLFTIWQVISNLMSPSGFSSKSLSVYKP